MEEDKIRDLFNAYKPELSSRLDFMDRLERNLDAVEIIHKANANVMRRNRVAVLAASIAGFISGIIFSFLIPYLNSATSIVAMKISTDNQFLCRFSEYQPIVTWLIIGAASVIISLYAYKIILKQGINFQLSKDGWQED